MIKFLKSGFYTTIQDLGRFEFQNFGMPISGVMDADAYRLANWLVGNEKNEPLLEATLVGPVIQFEAAASIAITGADMNPKLNGELVEMYKTIRVEKGAVLKLGTVKSGCRSYISFANGFCIEKEMGSFSTYANAKLGGGVIQKGTSIPLNPSKENSLREVPEEFRLHYSESLTLRVLAGPEKSMFPEKELISFFSNEYKITTKSNRMGYRLEGTKLTVTTSEEMLSSGIVKGTIQVPKDGQPIILMSDAQTTGGYPRIANVISVDIPYLAQQKPSDTIRFTEVSLEEAQSLLNNKQKAFQRLFAK